MKVLIAVDGSTGSFSAAEFVHQRLGLPADMELTLLTVVPTGHSGHDAEIDQHADDLLQETARRLAVHDDEAGIRIRTRRGHAAHEIVAECRDWEADLVVVGSHGYGAVHRFLLGSVSQKVLKYAPCSVLIVRSPNAAAARTNETGAPAGPLRILVGFDGSGPAHAAVDFVCQFFPAAGMDVRIVGVQVVIRFYRMDVLQKQSPEWLRHKQELSSELQEAAARIARSSLTVSADIHEGEDEGEVLLDAADRVDAELVVVGATGRSAVEQFLLGSVSHRVAHHAKSSVLVVREGRSHE